MYQHPAKRSEPIPQDESVPVCLAFVAGYCSFGSQCRNRHPSEQVVASLRAEYSNTSCRHADSCTNSRCLYNHPDVALRIDADGQQYPRSQFLAYYDGLEQWQHAPAAATIQQQAPRTIQHSPSSMDAALAEQPVCAQHSLCSRDDASTVGSFAAVALASANAPTPVTHSSTAVAAGDNRDESAYSSSAAGSCGHVKVPDGLWHDSGKDG